MKKRSTKCFCTILHKLFSHVSAKLQTYSFDRTENLSKIRQLYLQQSFRLFHESVHIQIACYYHVIDHRLNKLFPSLIVSLFNIILRTRANFSFNAFGQLEDGGHVNATKTVRDLYQWICMITRLKILKR